MKESYDNAMDRVNSHQTSTMAETSPRLAALREIAGVLDVATGDTDPNTWLDHEGREMTDDEICDEWPVWWAGRKLNSLL